MKIQVFSELGGIGTTALIDSGATVSFLPREIAKDMLQLEAAGEPTEVQGAGSTFPCEIVTLPLLKLMKSVNVIHEYEDVRMHVPLEPVELPYAILGRDSIFRDFEITFREREQRFKLKEY